MTARIRGARAHRGVVPHPGRVPRGVSRFDVLDYDCGTRAGRFSAHELAKEAVRVGIGAGRQFHPAPWFSVAPSTAARTHVGAAGEGTGAGNRTAAGRSQKQAIALWDTIPGVDETVASILVAELGIRPEQFPDAASWVAICPGNNETRKTEIRQDPERKSLAPGSVGRSGLGRSPLQGNVSERAVSMATKSRSRDSTQSNSLLHNNFAHPARSNIFSGEPRP